MKLTDLVKKIIPSFNVKVDKEQKRLEQGVVAVQVDTAKKVDLDTEAIVEIIQEANVSPVTAQKLAENADRLGINSDRHDPGKLSTCQTIDNLLPACQQTNAF